MNVYVINLPEAEERRAFQQRQLTALGLSHQFVDAVNKNEVSQVLDGIPCDLWERALMPTELACFASHHRVWQRIVHDNVPALVLEDDVLLSSRVPQFLALAESRLQFFQHLSLETRLRHKLIGPIQALTPDLGYARLYRDRTGAAAYILWPSGAQRLLAQAQIKGAALADAFIANDYGLLSFQAVPPLAIQSDIAVSYGVVNGLQTISYIQAHGPRAEYKAQGRAKWRMKWRRIRAQFRQAGRLLGKLGVARRVHLAPDPQGFTFVQEQAPS